MYNILKNEEVEGINIPEFMLMEYMTGIEYTIECIAFNGDLITAIPRRKPQSSRIREIVNNQEMIEIARNIVKRIRT